jgi:para-nitrobenzyl esterase
MMIDREKLRIRSVLVLCAVAAACALCLPIISAAATPGLQSGKVRIDKGILHGSVENGIVSFKGIPYAQPPIGNIRWEPPQPVTAWSGQRDATHFGHDCMQIPDPMEAAPQGSTTPSEDCLYMNLWAPVEPAQTKRAVIVWIHGGGFINGGSSTPIYDGSGFAKQGAIFISFNFRLGRFGFFAHPALTAERPDGLLGNYAYMDQIAVLQWIHRNIAAFGGDPANVTVIGESAGGGSVHFLANSPLARGLLAKAIIESGGGRDSAHPRQLHDDQPGVPSGETLGLEFAQKHGITGTSAQALAALRKLPAMDIVDNLNIINRRANDAVGATFPGPMIEGKLLLHSSQAGYLAHTQAKIPMIVGGNDADLAYPVGHTIEDFLKPFGSDAAKARAVYDPQNTGDAKKFGEKTARDRGQLEPARFIARTLSSQGQTVYEFRFSYIATSMRGEWPDGAPHASEVPFVFETLHARYDGKATADDEAMARTISGYWVAFAKTGDPNGGNRPHWPAYNAQKDILANFTNHGVVIEPDSWKTRLDLTEASHRNSN